MSIGNDTYYYATIENADQKLILKSDGNGWKFIHRKKKNRFHLIEVSKQAHNKGLLFFRCYCDIYYYACDFWGKPLALVI